MRLEQPNALAKRLVQGTPGWSDEQIDIAIASGSTRRIVLAKPVPVFIFYWSVFVGDDGQVSLRPDLYGWDQQLNGLL
jgi:murein L,D-transpeptidase YcbB/YkuD